MEYLEGANLAERLEAGDLTASETRRLLRQICGALEAAHRAGIVHRDLKPENIWVAAPAHEDSFAKVLDFGIAKLLDNPAGKSTQTGAAMGTPRYMAPEQCMGRPVDHRADIYSLGVILYEIFAGIVPFRGESFGELIYQHMSEPPEPPSRHRPMDPELERIILACLEKDPAKRPESAKELGRLLNLAVHEGNEPVTQLRTAVLTARPSAAVGTTMGQSIGEVVVAARARGETRRRAGGGGRGGAGRPGGRRPADEKRLDDARTRRVARTDAARRRGADADADAHDRAPAAAHRRRPGQSGQPRRARGRARRQRRRLRRARSRARIW